MHALEMRVPIPTNTPVPKSRLDPTVYITGLVVTVSTLVLTSGSIWLAVALVGVALAAWVLAETMTVTVFLHRYLTHGAIGWIRPWLVRLFLWLTRSGFAKYHEWVENHAAHHVLTDTEGDSYTPNAFMKRIGMKPLMAPRPWNFWYNGLGPYRATSKFYDEHPEELLELADQHPEVRAALDRLAGIEWGREQYSRVVRAMFLNVVLYSIVATPLVFAIGGIVAPVVLLGLPWVFTGIKASLYLYGGYVINYYGHQAKASPYQSNIPWWLMLLTFFELGEGWHRFHHDAPYAARFHRVFDPGYWFVWCCAKLRQMSNITVAKRVGHRQYQPQQRFAV